MSITNFQRTVQSLHDSIIGFCALEETTSTTLDACQWALRHAADGFRVFPLKPNGKRPLFEGWPDLATSDPVQIEAWWRKWPKANIGILCGEPLNDGYLAVFDVDIKRDGETERALLELEHGPIGATRIVKTASGGRHFYLRTEHPTANSASKIGDGLDWRGHHGFVVAPGSTIDGHAYRTVSDAPIAPCPDWLERLAGAPRTIARDNAPIVELDTPDAVDRARNWLTTAETAVEGAGGDHRTYITASGVLDFGVSEDTALDLMLEHWNPNCAPPWHPEDLQTKIANAAKYRQDPVGRSSPAADFGAPTIEPNTSTLIPPFVPGDPRDIRRRPWVYGNLLMRGTVSALIAPPGASKSTFSLASALAIATGRPLLGIDVRETTRVAVWNNEDDLDELRRRLYAAMQHFRITASDIAPDGHPALHLQSGETRPFMIARKVSTTVGTVMQPADVAAVRDELLRLGIGVLVVDPFVETHPANENDNAEMAHVARLYRQLAQEANCAVLLIHHTRKPEKASSTSMAGDMSGGRGASAVVGVIRQGATLYTMTADEAKDYGIDERDRHRYARYDEGKANMALLSGEPRWFRRESVNLPTWDFGPGEPEGFDEATGQGFGFESVGVLDPVDLQPIEGRDMEREVLLRDMAALLSEQPEGLTVNALAKGLAGLSLWSESQPEALRKRIRRTLGQGLDWPGGRFDLSAANLNNSGGGKVARTVVRFTAASENTVNTVKRDHSEEPSANEIGS